MLKSVTFKCMETFPPPLADCVLFIQCTCAYEQCTHALRALSVFHLSEASLGPGLPLSLFISRDSRYFSASGTAPSLPVYINQSAC